MLLPHARTVSLPPCREVGYQYRLSRCADTASAEYSTLAEGVRGCARSRGGLGQLWGCGSDAPELAPPTLDPNISAPETWRMTLPQTSG